MNEIQSQLLLGSLLGDGGLAKQKHGKNACFYEHHSFKQKDYLYFKYSILRDLCKSEPKPSKSYSKKYKKYYKGIRLRTRHYEELTDLWHLWYKNKKIVPIDEVKRLTPFGLSIWFSDDGSATLPSRRIISTCGFTQEENELLRDVLRTNFQITPDVMQDPLGYHYLCFTKSNMRRLVEIIKPHTHPSMMYKIESVSKRQRHFTMSEAAEIRQKYKTGKYSQRALAKEYKVSCGTICCTINGNYSCRDPNEWI